MARNRRLNVPLSQAPISQIQMNPQQPYLNSKTFLNSLAVNDNNSSQLKTCSPDFKSTIPSDKPLFRRTSPRLHSQELPQTQSRERIVNEEQRDFEEEKTKEDQIPMFPASFNPRRASNMPAREKVQNWMKDIPFHYSTDTVSYTHLDVYKRQKHGMLKRQLFYH